MCCIFAAFMYKAIRNFLFLFPPEPVHYFSMNALRWACKINIVRKAMASSFRITGPAFEKEAFGLHFRNPIGLGAGFDKNALYLAELDILGFGFVEIGTVTPKPQTGNEKPRLFRLRKDRALINRMGFNNDGVLEIADRLRAWKTRASQEEPGKRLVIGGNIGKNKSTPNEDAWKDYEICFRELFDCVDYFVVNVSSPNTPGLRALQEKGALRKILSHLQSINQENKVPKSILLKIAPDLSFEQLDEVIEIALETGLSGLVATNTTTSREGLLDSGASASLEAGGLSGAPLRGKSSEIVKYIHDQSHGKIPIIASGGIFNSKDAKEKIEAGGTLLQVWTGFIYEGPGICKKILAHLGRVDSNTNL